MAESDSDEKAKPEEAGAQQTILKWAKKIEWNRLEGGLLFECGRIYQDFATH